MKIDEIKALEELTEKAKRLANRLAHLEDFAKHIDSAQTFALRLFSGDNERYFHFGEDGPARQAFHDLVEDARKSIQRQIAELPSLAKPASAPGSKSPYYKPLLTGNELRILEAGTHVVTIRSTAASHVLLIDVPEGWTVEEVPRTPGEP